MKTRKLEVRLTDQEIEDWEGLSPEEVEEMLRQGARDRLLGKVMQNPGHSIYRKGYSNYSTIEELIELTYKVFKPRVA